MKTYQVPPVHAPVRREILYWQARIGRQVIDTNNSLPLLRFKHRDNKQVTFHSVR